MIRYPARCIYSDTPWLGLQLFSDSPTTAIVCADCRRLAITAAQLLAIGAPPDEPLESLDLFLTQMPELARLEWTQLQKSNPHPLQFLHQPAAVFEHHPDLVLATFNQANFVPRIFRAPHQLQPGGRGHAALHRDTASELFLLLRRYRAVHLHQGC